MNFPARLILAFVFCLSLSAQYHPGGGRGIAGGANNVGPVVDAVASFDGVFKAADKKFIEIQVESGEIMRMYITRSTKFVRDGKTAKPADFQDGEKVMADATRDARMNLLAVRVEKAPETKKPESKPDDKPAK